MNCTDLLVYFINYWVSDNKVSLVHVYLLPVNVYIDCLVYMIIYFHLLKDFKMELTLFITHRKIFIFFLIFRKYSFFFCLYNQILF